MNLKLRQRDDYGKKTISHHFTRRLPWSTERGLRRAHLHVQNQSPAGRRSKIACNGVKNAPTHCHLSATCWSSCPVLKPQQPVVAPCASSAMMELPLKRRRQRLQVYSELLQLLCISRYGNRAILVPPTTVILVPPTRTPSFGPDSPDMWPGQPGHVAQTARRTARTLARTARTLARTARTFGPDNRATCPGRPGHMSGLCGPHVRAVVCAVRAHPLKANRSAPLHPPPPP